MFLYYMIRRFWGFWHLYNNLNRKWILSSLTTILWNYYMSVQSGYVGKNAVFKNEPCFPHGQKGVFISGGAKIGENCVIYQNVTIGSNDNKNSKKYGAPTIGNNVLIGAGATIIGNVVIGNNVRISANCAVNEDIPDDSYVFPVKGIIIKNEDC